VTELRTYLLAKYDDRFKVHPKKYEELVASVFSDFGYKVRVTSFSGDDGIDVFILDGDGNDVVGIQVKRYKKKIEAEQIRSFAGALMLNGVTNGVFVTASDYRSGAIATSQRYNDKGISILLQDAKAFYDRMRIGQRPPYESRDDPSAPFFLMCQSPDKIPYLWTHAW
jgi:restriction system protein